VREKEDVPAATQSCKARIATPPPIPVINTLSPFLTFAFVNTALHSVEGHSVRFVRSVQSQRKSGKRTDKPSKLREVRQPLPHSPNARDIPRDHLRSRRYTRHKFPFHQSVWHFLKSQKVFLRHRVPRVIPANSRRGQSGLVCYEVGASRERSRDRLHRLRELRGTRRKRRSFLGRGIDVGIHLGGWNQRLESWWVLDLQHSREVSERKGDSEIKLSELT